MAIGDFNVILASSKKYRGLTKGRQCPYFVDFVDSTELYDLGFRELPFTWHRGFLFERLDRTLGKPVSNEEIKVALFDMALLKALDSDGFHALFFQKQWGTIGGAICD
ncbi:hypothetical protein J1N35_028417 [Gossypium stocksii]|uniref:Uncharacterized protein n=1 Tax=Gossypium stocksii TaxID=47602 RepID=A0A9D3ZSL0_9ROSI|nr:hypothetical protein J1N35_028417 [Gossypium stocksii]